MILFFACLNKEESAMLDSEPASVCVEAGEEVGEGIAELGLFSCGEEPVAFQNFCGSPLLVVSWYGWCPSCQQNTEVARALKEEHPELAVVVALEEDPLGVAVEPSLCEQYQQTYPSQAEVWMDPAKMLELYGSTDLVLVADQTGTLVFQRQTSTESAIRAAVEEVL
jgi:hypothetical protein